MLLQQDYSIFVLKSCDMGFDQIIDNISTGFTDAWNSGNIELSIKFLCPNVVIESPKVKEIFPEKNESKVVGHEEVRHYWKQLQNRYGKLEVEQVSLKKVNREIYTVNKVKGKNLTIHETFIVNEYGKIEYLKYHYESNDSSSIG